MDTNKDAKKRKHNHNGNRNEENVIDLTTINENYTGEKGAKRKATTIIEGEPSVKRKTNATQRIAFFDLTSSEININKTKAKPTATITSAAVIDLSTFQDTATIAQVPVVINQPKIATENVSASSGSQDEVPVDRTNTFISHETLDIMPKPDVNGTYSELQKLEHTLGIVLNTEPFECSVCFEKIESNDGIVLRNCLHSFCKLCITNLILRGENIIAKCPYMDDDLVCDEEIQEREVRDLLTEEQFEKYPNKRGTKRKHNYNGNRNEANVIDLTTINENYIDEIGAKRKITTIIEDEPSVKRKTTLDENATKRIAFFDLTTSEININKMKAKPTATITSGAIIDVDQYIFENAASSSITSAAVIDLTTVQDTATIAQVPVTINQPKIVTENVTVSSGPQDELAADQTNTFISHETLDIMPKPVVNGTYSELQKLEHTLGIVLNTEPFECRACLEKIEPNNGILLRNCLHSFCKLCTTSSTLCGENIIAKCPYIDVNYECDEELQEREIRELLTEEQFEKYLKRTISFAEQNTTNSFHCKKPDCTGWCEFDDNVNDFFCPVCHSHNCINCGAIHTGKNCREYQDDLVLNDVDKESKNSIESLIAEGASMRCPKCQIVIVKDDGCDGIICPTCGTDICWATKGLRWGPNGRGDTSGGCQCDWENQRPCHPNCQDCH